MLNKKNVLAMMLGSLLVAGPAFADAPINDKLADPDGKPADMSKPVKVFIVMGQSNTLEMGRVAGDKDGTLDKAVKEENLYPFLVDDAGNWTTRADVRNVSVMQKRGNMNVYRNEWLTVEGKKNIGIEVGIGNALGTYFDEPVMVLKSSIGNRSLGWDLLPPGSKRYTYNGGEVPGYKETIKSKTDKTIVPFVEGGDCLQWYAGKQYDDDVANAKKVLADLGKYYPGATKYEVAGFIWWQGDKDRYNEAHAANYGKNLHALYASLKKDFDAPDAKFVLATLGQTDMDAANGNEKLILDGMMAFANDPELKGDVALVYSHPLSMGSSSNAHYGGNAKTYINVGLGLGEAMADLFKAGN